MVVQEVANQQAGECCERVRGQRHEGDQTVAHADALLHERNQERMQRAKTESNQNDSRVCDGQRVVTRVVCKTEKMITCD